ncbi:MAG: restriction endonuclease subunit S [Candidatus Latescibacteria bacterium]|nr:restriction endonuclease subunit S [Candidatus Latescibacterota bacterium]
MKAYPEYKESGFDWIGKFPSHWTLCSLGYKSRMIVPMRDKPQEFDGDIPWIRIEDFNGKYISGSKSDQKVSETTVVNMNLKVFPVGTVLCSCSCSMGATAIVSNPLISNQTFIGIVPNEDLHSDYLYYLVQAAKPTLDSLGTGAIQKYLSRNDFEHFKVAFPLLPEQQAIADFLDRKTAQTDALIENKWRQIDLLQEQHTALIYHAVTEGLNPDVPMKDLGVEWLDKIPSHWEFVKTKYLFRLVTEKAPDDNGMELLSLYTEIGVRPRKDLEARGNKASTTDGYWIVKEGDIIINKLLAWMGAVGYSAYDGVTSPAYDILRKTVPLNSKFYHYLLRCGIVLPEFKRRSRGIMEMRLRLYFDELGQIPLVYPPETEQNQIVEYLEDLEENVNRTISKITKEIELLQEYRTALISEAVTGKIDVRTAETVHE